MKYKLTYNHQTDGTPIFQSADTAQRKNNMRSAITIDTGVAGVLFHTQGVLANKKVSVIKALRRVTGMGLNDAVDLANRIESQISETHIIESVDPNEYTDQGISNLRMNGFTIEPLTKNINDLLCEAVVTAIDSHEYTTACLILDLLTKLTPNGHPTKIVQRANHLEPTAWSLHTFLSSKENAK